MALKIQATEGFFCFVWGFFKKYYVAFMEGNLIRIYMQVQLLQHITSEGHYPDSHKNPVINCNNICI